MSLYWKSPTKIPAFGFTAKTLLQLSLHSKYSIPNHKNITFLKKELALNTI
jgi:hypothetical protein